jgi:glycosyltransferase involved in cell wall biosynthesis
VPLVVTVHDLAVLRHPEAFNRWTRIYSPRVVPGVLRAAQRVIAVSEFTRRELVELLGVPDRKIRVVPNAVGDEFTSEGPAADGDYVLAVGTLEPRKNLDRLVDAVRRTDRELRVVGARGWGGIEVKGNGVRWLGEVDDAELARLYRGATCVAYPSLYEGFGIPILEAMACGAPVVTTRGTAMEEVADGAAVLVDARDPVEIAAGIERAAAERETLVARGLERARAFRWDAVAAATVEVYREAAE